MLKMNYFKCCCVDYYLYLFVGLVPTASPTFQSELPAAAMAQLLRQEALILQRQNSVDKLKDQAMLADIEHKIADIELSLQTDAKVLQADQELINRHSAMLQRTKDLMLQILRDNSSVTKN